MSVEAKKITIKVIVERTYELGFNSNIGYFYLRNVLEFDDYNFFYQSFISYADVIEIAFRHRNIDLSTRNKLLKEINK